MKIPVFIELDSDAILEAALEKLSQEEVFELIKDLDLAMADFDFTERLALHFAAEVDACNKADAQ